MQRNIEILQRLNELNSDIRDSQHHSSNSSFTNIASSQPEDQSSSELDSYLSSSSLSSLEIISPAPKSSQTTSSSEYAYGIVEPAYLSDDDNSLSSPQHNTVSPFEDQVNQHDDLSVGSEFTESSFHTITDDSSDITPTALPSSSYTPPDHSTTSSQTQASSTQPSSPSSYTPTSSTPTHRKAQHKNYSKRKKQKRKLNTKIYPPSHLESTEFNGILPHKHDHVLRFVLQNPNGITGGTRHGKLLEIISALKLHKLDFLALPESHINPYSTMRKQIDNIYNELVQYARITHSNTPTDTINTGNMQYGGVSSMLSSKMCRHLSSTEHDPLGRWHCHSFFTKKSLLKNYTLYRPNKGSTKNELSAWTTQNWHILKKNLQTTPEKLVVDDLVEQLKKDIEKDCDIMIMADANEHLQSSNPYLHEQLADLGLINVLKEKFGSNLPPTHTRGSHAIDNIWVTPRIFAAITDVGILPLNELFGSDHRALFLDLNLNLIFGDDIELISTFDRRRLKSSNIKRKVKYVTYVENQMDKQNVHGRLEKLENMINNNAPREDIIRLIESIDRQIHEIMMAAERQLPHIHSMHWTPEVTSKLVYLHKLNGKRRHLIKDSTINNTNNKEDIAEIDTEKEEIKRWFSKRTLTSEQIRDDFLDSLATEYHAQGKFKKKEHAVKVLKNIEKQKRDSVQMGAVLKPFEHQGLPFIKVPAPEDYEGREGFEHANYKDIDTIWRRIEMDQGKDVKAWTSITNKEDMEPMLIHWKQKHFKQANTTNISSPDWIRMLQQQIDEEVPDIQEAMKTLSENESKFLDNLLQNPTEICKYKMSFFDFQSFIDSKDERTASSPSGRHYGHLKSVRHSYVLEYIFKIISSSIQLNYIPTRWAKTLTTLVPKDDEPFIHRLRPIHIIEPEIQFISHQFWAKTFMKESEAAGLLTDSQYGGRRGRQAQNGILKQVLIWDIVKLQNKYLASHLADARANFDRNMSHIVGLALKSRNFDPHMIKFYQNYLQSQIFFLRTSFGTTSNSYTYDPDDPHYGDGQGIGWSSVNQILISTVIDQVYQSIAPHFQITSIDDFFKIMTGVNFFIDDRISNTINHNNNLTELMAEFQSNENLQVELLNASGGAVAPKKCAWWLLAKTQGKLGFSLEHKSLNEFKLHLKNTGDDHPYEIEHLPPEVVQKYLGALVSPLMPSKPQIKKLRIKIKAWCKKIMHSRLSPKQIIKAYKEYLVPALAYPLVVCDLTYEECDALMAPIRKTIGKKTSYHTSTKKCITHGPKELLGEELPHLFDIAGNEKLSFLFYHIRNMQNKEDTVAEAIHISLMDHMLQLGNFNNIFNLDYDKWSKLLPTNTWISSVWKYLFYYKNNLDFANLPTYDLPFENDFFIMEEILKEETDPEKLEKFNRVRMQLKLLTASDIALPCGSQLHPDLLRKENNFKSRDSSFNWPNPEELPDSWYILFRSMLKDYIAPRIDTKPIGAKIEGRTSHQFRTASLISDSRFHLDGQQYIRTRGNNFILATDLLNFTPQKFVDVYRTGKSNMKLVSDTKKSTISLEPENSSNIFHNAPEWLSSIWGIDNIDPTEIDALRPKLQAPILIVSDGGVPDGETYGVYAWALADYSGKIFYKNGGAIGGLGKDQDSFRAEAYGAFAAVSFLNFLEQHDFELCSERKYYSDNKQVTLLRASSYIHPKKSQATKKHYDIKIQLQCALQESALSVKPFFQHVKGHQDRVKAFQHCTPEEQVNILVDKHCHVIHKQLQNNPSLRPPDISPFLPAQAISIRNSLHRFVQKSYNESHVDSRHSELLTSILDDLHIEDDHYHLIHWDALRLFSNTHRNNSHRKFLKILHRKWLTMRERKKMNPSHNGLCPLCGEEEENFDHILTCSSPTACEARLKATRTFKNSLRNAKTPDYLIQAFASYLTNFSCTNQEIRDLAEEYPEHNDAIIRAFSLQGDLGWHLAFSGLIVKDWSDLIASYYKLIGERKSPILWCRDLIRALMTWAHDIWCARCNFIHKANKTHLDELRIVLFNKCQYYNDPRQRHEVGRYTYILKRSRSFFNTASEVALTLWGDRLNQALKDTIKEAKKQPRIDSIFTPVSHPTSPPSTKKKKTRRPKVSAAKKKRITKAQKTERAAKMHRYIHEFFQTKQDFHDRYLNTFLNMTSAPSASSSSIASSLQPD